MKTALILVAALTALTGAMLSLPLDDDAHHLLISQAVARPLGDGTAAGTLTIDNRGAPDRLLAVRSSAADVSLYAPSSEGGVPVPTGSAGLALDAAHIALTGLGAQAEHGALIPVTLTFAKAGEVTTRLTLSDPAKAGPAQKHGLFGIGDICIVGEGEPAPAITLSVTQTPTGHAVHIHTDQFEFSRDLMGLYHVPGMGHGHIYVGGMKLGRLFEPTATIGALPPGRHEVRVTLNTNDHRAYVVDDQPVTARAVIQVD